MTIKNSVKTAILSLTIAMLSACGGGDSKPSTVNSSAVSAPIVNAAPIASAGPDQNVIVSTTVTVDGGASSDANGDLLNFKWILSARPPSSAAVLSATTDVRPIFVADVAGIYVATLIVNDGKADSAPVTTVITAYAKQISGNTPPVANAGPNQSVPVGTSVVLNGGASSDANSNSLAYKWTLISKPAGSVSSLLGTNGMKPQFVVDAVGTYAVTLMVNDGIVDSAPATVFINAITTPSSANASPVANAGPDQTVTTGATINLDAALSADPNGDHLTYLWAFISRPLGSNAAFTSPNLMRSQFVADVTGIYEVSLVVHDGKASSATGDIISIVAMPANAVAIPDNGTYRCATLTKQAALALYAQGHTYLDRDHDGRPCEANDILNEVANPYVAPVTNPGAQCYVKGYYRKNGTYVKGYYRRCPS